MAAFGSTSEVQLVGDREKIADLVHFHAGLRGQSGPWLTRVSGQPAANTGVNIPEPSIARCYQVQAYSVFQSAGLFRDSSARCCTSPQQQSRGGCTMTHHTRTEWLR